MKARGAFSDSPLRQLTKPANARISAGEKKPAEILACCVGVACKMRTLASRMRSAPLCYAARRLAGRLESTAPATAPTAAPSITSPRNSDVEKALPPSAA